MANSGSSFCFAPLPIFDGKDYKQWEKKMRTFFISQGFWNLVQNGINLKAPAAQRRREKRKDSQALYYIQQAVTPTIFSKFVDVSSAKNAWDFLETEYNHPTKFLEGIESHSHIVEIFEKSDPACGIRDIPKNVRDVNPAAYTPQTISIGPLHHGKTELANMEKRKFIFANNFLKRTQKPKQDFALFVARHEEFIRGWYSKPSELISRDYVEMILLDSFFIFELFIWCQANTTATEYADDSQLHEQWFRNSIMIDLMLLENQLPYRILSELYHIGFEDDSENPGFARLCLMYFQAFNHKQILLKEEDCKNHLHFTGLVRHFSCSKTEATAAAEKKPKKNIKLKFPANKLSESKVKFYGIQDGSSSDIIFMKRKRVLKLPQFKVDNVTERLYRNLMGLEQCHFKERAYICSYILLLQLLIQSSDDVAVLVEDGVIINALDSNQAVVDMFKKLCKNITIDHFYLYDTCKKLDDYCSGWYGWWNYCRKILKDVYFSNIWRGTGTVAAVVLLLLTLAQTVTSILQVM